MSCSCTKEKGKELLNEGQNLVFLKQIGDWKIVPGPDADSVPRLRREIKAKNFLSALAVFERIAPMAEEQGETRNKCRGRSMISDSSLDSVAITT